MNLTSGRRVLLLSGVLPGRLAPLSLLSWIPTAILLWLRSVQKRVLGILLSMRGVGARFICSASLQQSQQHWLKLPCNAPALAAGTDGQEALAARCALQAHTMYRAQQLCSVSSTLQGQTRA